MNENTIKFKNQSTSHKSKLFSKLLWNQVFQLEVPTLNVDGETMPTVETNSTHLCQVMLKTKNSGDSLEEEISVELDEVNQDQTKLKISEFDAIKVIGKMNQNGALGCDYITQRMLIICNQLNHGNKCQD